MPTEHSTSIDLDLMGLDCPFLAEVKFVQHPAIRGDYYQPPEPAHIEVTKVQIFERVRAHPDTYRHEERECPAWLHEWIASHSYTLEECESAMGSLEDERADYLRDKLLDQ